MSKAILFIGGVLAMGLTWLLAALYLASSVLSLQVEGAALAAVALLCHAAAAVVSWRLFVRPRA
jgi:hypothetical protein